MRFIRQIKRVINLLARYRLKIYHANVSKELEKLMTKYGSDKGNLNKHHNFANLYSSIFSDKRDYIKNFLEVGLGSNNTELLSNLVNP